MVVFCDKAGSFDADGNVRFNVIAEIKRKLSAPGISGRQIGDVRGCRNYAQRQQLFTAVNEGEVRIIFGSTAAIGAGTSFQKKLKSNAHLDAPWLPVMVTRSVSERGVPKEV